MSAHSRRYPHLPLPEELLPLPEQRLALTALSRWLDPSEEISGLFLQGPSGTGKTALVDLVSAAVTSHDQPQDLRRTTASQFAAELAEASDARTIAQFQKNFRRGEALIIEDLTGIELRPESQQQLELTVEEYLRNGRPVLLTSRKPVGELRGFSRRFISRCRAFLNMALPRPGIESRRLLLKHFARRRRLPLTDELIALLAAQPDVTPRELSGLILRLETIARQLQRPLDRSTVTALLESDAQPPKLTLAEIARRTAQHFDIPLARLRSTKRDQTSVLARQCAMLLMRELTSSSLEKVGAYFGGRDHSTVVRACQRLETLQADDPEIRRHLQQLRIKLGRDA